MLPRSDSWEASGLLDGLWMVVLKCLRNYDRGLIVPFHAREHTHAIDARLCDLF